MRSLLFTSTHWIWADATSVKGYLGQGLLPACAPIKNGLSSPYAYLSPHTIVLFCFLVLQSIQAISLVLVLFLGYPLAVEVTNKREVKALLPVTTILGHIAKG